MSWNTSAPPHPAPPLRPAAGRTAAAPRLGGLLLSGALAWSGCTPTPAVDTAPQAAFGTPTPRAPGGAAPRTEPALRLDALAAAADRPGPVDARNPFRFPPAPHGSGDASRPGGTAARAADPAAPPVVTARPAAADPGGADPPPAPVEGPALRVIGVVNAPDAAGRVAVVTDGRRVLHGRVDDLLHGRYRLLAIDAASVTLEDLRGGNPVTLPRPDPDRPTPARP